MLRKVLFIILVAAFIALPVYGQESGEQEYIDLVVDYPKNSLKIGENSGGPYVYLVDDQGNYHERQVSPNHHIFLLSDHKAVTINNKGELTNLGGLRQPETVKVFVIDREYDLIGSASIFLENEYAGFKYTVDNHYPEVGQEVNVKIDLLAELESFSEDIKVAVELDKDTRISGVTIQVKDDLADQIYKTGQGEFQVVADEPGLININIMLSTSDGLSFKQKAAIEVFPPLPTKIIRGASEVIMFLNSTGYLQDGNLVNASSAPFIMKDRVFVPIRPLADSFKAEIKTVSNNGKVKVVTLIRNDRIITVPIGHNLIHIQFPNGMIKVVSTDVPATIVNGRTVLPFRAIAEAFDAQVDFGLNSEGRVDWVKFVQ